MKKIELNKLRAGQMVEAIDLCVPSPSGQAALIVGKLYPIKAIYDGLASIINKSGREHFFDKYHINTYFRLPVLTEGKEYECVETNNNCLTIGKKYKYLNTSNDSFLFECDMYPSKNDTISPHHFCASEVFTHFGIVVGEENCCTNCGSELHDTEMCPTISDQPKPEVNWKLVSEGEYISQLQSRIKELEGEVKYFQSIYLDMTNKAVELKIDNQSLKANGQEEN